MTWGSVKPFAVSNPEQSSFVIPPISGFGSGRLMLSHEISLVA